MAEERMSLPSSGAGITSYFNDYKSKISFKPGVIIILVIIVIALEIFLHLQGTKILGLQ